MLHVQVKLGERELVQRPLGQVFLQQVHQLGARRHERCHYIFALTLVVHCFLMHFLVFLDIEVVFWDTD